MLKGSCAIVCYTDRRQHKLKPPTVQVSVGFLLDKSTIHHKIPHVVYALLPVSMHLFLNIHTRPGFVLKRCKCFEILYIFINFSLNI